jgi:hemerythrin-like metal-binding protein
MATGVRQIDLQHQELIALINELEAALAAGREAQALGEALPKLTAYILFHFGTEESLMKNSGIASEHFALHKQQHKSFAEHIGALRSHPDAATLPALIDYLKTWLVEHIMRSDRDLVATLGPHAHSH